MHRCVFFSFVFLRFSLFASKTSVAAFVTATFAKTIT